MINDISGFLKNVVIFQGLTEDDIKRIGEICRQEEKKAGEVVFIEQSTGRELYIVCEGDVEIQLEMISPDEIIPIRHMFPGDIFGELALIDAGPRSATARAVKDSSLLVIDREDFDRLISSDNRLGYVVMQNLAKLVCDRIRRTNQRLLDNVSWGLV